MRWQGNAEESRTTSASSVDLHLHTTASDGVYSPSDIVRLALQLGLKTIAITDHDTVSGVDEALQSAAGQPLQVIPGIELSSDVPQGEVHMLGYFVDTGNSHLVDVLERLRNARIERARRMVEKLAAMGLPLSWERVQELASGESIGRPHVAQAMLERGYVQHTAEAFEHYIGRTGPAYAGRYKLSPVDSVGLIIRAGGLPVLAHPDPCSDTFAGIALLVEHGLAGVEAYYDAFPQEQIELLVDTAKRYNLVATGGSDFHGINPLEETPIGGVFVPEESVDQLMALIARRAPQTALD